MTHKFMDAVATGLADAQHRDAALSVSLYGERRKRPDPPAVAHATVRAAVAAAAAQLPGLAAIRGRQVVRRPHDLAGAGERATARRARARVSSASRCIRPASRPSNAARICRKSKCRCCSCRAPGMRSPSRPDRAAGRLTRQACDVASRGGRGPFLSCAGAIGAQGCAGDGRDSRCDGGVGGADALRRLNAGCTHASGFNRT